MRAAIRDSFPPPPLTTRPASPSGSSSTRTQQHTCASSSLQAARQTANPSKPPLSRRRNKHHHQQHHYRTCSSCTWSSLALRCAMSATPQSDTHAAWRYGPDSTSAAVSWRGGCDGQGGRRGCRASVSRGVGRRTGRPGQERVPFRWGSVLGSRCGVARESAPGCSMQWRAGLAAPVDVADQLMLLCSGGPALATSHAPHQLTTPCQGPRPRARSAPPRPPTSM